MKYTLKWEKSVYLPKNKMVLKSYFSLTSHWNFSIKSCENSIFFISGAHLCFLSIIFGF